MFQPGTIGLAHRGLFRGHLHQAADGVARPVQGLGLNQLGHGEQEHHHRRFRPLANQDRARHRDAHQGIDIEVEVLQGNPALLVGGKAAAENRHQRHQRDYPGGCHTSEMQHLGPQGTHARHRQRPPMFLGGRRGGGAAFFDRVGLHADGLDCLNDRRRVRQVMGDAEDAVDQVEFQLLHASELAQLVLDQRLLGRAVHGFDAEGAQARAGGGRLTQGHDGRPGSAGAAGAGMAVVIHRREFGGPMVMFVIMAVVMSVIVIVIVIMLVVVLVRGMNGVAHQVASVKVPVAK